MLSMMSNAPKGRHAGGSPEFVDNPALTPVTAFHSSSSA